MLRRLSLTVLLGVVMSGCASLDGLRAFIQPPRFEQTTDRPSEIRLNSSGASVPTGASIRLWTTVSNPNAFGLTLGTLRGTLHLEGTRAATVDFPLGLPLAARGVAEVPIDISVDFRDIPSLAQAISRAVTRQPIEYALEGTIGVSAGAFGEPVFGPMTLMRGAIR